MVGLLGRLGGWGRKVSLHTQGRRKCANRIIITQGDENDDDDDEDY